MKPLIKFDMPKSIFTIKRHFNANCEQVFVNSKKATRMNIKVDGLRNLLLFFLLVSFNSLSQSIWTNPITGTDPGLSNPYTIGQTVNANITVSGIGRGAGVNGNAGVDRYNTNGWNTGAIDLTAYFEFTLTPNSGCEIDFTSFVYTGQASGTGPTNFAIRSNVDSYAANIGTPTATGSTINLSGATYQNITGAITFRLYGWGASSATGTFSINDFTFNGSTSCGAPANTITTGTVSTSPFAVDCSTSATGTVAFTSTGTFNAGNVYTAQLSDASGSFVSPTAIGTLTSTAISGTINITIPAGTVSGTGYRIRVISSNPAVTGTSSGTFTINLSGAPCITTPPYMTALMINSCQTGGCDEGHNELIFGNTGDYSVLANAANLDIRYGTTYPASADYTSSLTTNAATTSLLNSEAGCAGLFVEGTGATMPPNSSFIVARSTLCPDALDWTSLCGSGPIYIIYSTSTSWSTGGNFTNAKEDVLRYLSTTITSTDASVHSIEYSFNCINNTPADGDYATWTSAGGFSSTHSNLSGCALSPILLPAGLISFTGQYIQGTTELNWQTSSEQNNSHFTISHTTDGKKFTPIGTVNGAGNSSELLNYRFIHQFPHPGMNYYKLQSTDYDGTTYEKGIVAIKADFSFSFYDSQTASIELFYESDIEIYSTDGKLVEMASDTKSIPFSKSGLFFILDKKSGITERLFIP